MEKILVILFVANVILAAASSALHALAAKFVSLNGADSLVAKIASTVAKVLDIASANVAHKDPLPEAPKS